MNKPKGFDDIQLGTVLNAGGHKCVIKEVQETQSKSGKDMLIILFDTSEEDTQPNFYTNQFLADTEKPDREAVWRGKQYLVTEGEYGPSNLKWFTTAVEDSNPGFEVKWGKAFANCFKNQKVGIVFRLEDYTASSGELRTAVKPFRFCSYDKAPEQAVPKRQEIPETQTQQSLFDQFQNMAQEGFMQVPDNLDDTEGLPFK